MKTIGKFPNLDDGENKAIQIFSGTRIKDDTARGKINVLLNSKSVGDDLDYDWGNQGTKSIALIRFILREYFCSEYPEELTRMFYNKFFRYLEYNPVDGENKAYAWSISSIDIDMWLQEVRAKISPTSYNEPTYHSVSS